MRRRHAKPTPRTMYRIQTPNPIVNSIRSQQGRERLREALGAGGVYRVECRGEKVVRSVSRGGR